MTKVRCPNDTAYSLAVYAKKFAERAIDEAGEGKKAVEEMRKILAGPRARDMNFMVAAALRNVAENMKDHFEWFEGHAKNEEWFSEMIKMKLEPQEGYLGR